MKKIIALTCIAASLLTNGVICNAQTTKTINNKEIQSFEYAGETIIPIRELENFGFKIEWSVSENRIYLSKPNNQITEFLIPNYQVDVAQIKEMYPTNTPRGNIETFGINGKGYMYFKDLSKFGVIQDDNAILEDKVEYIATDPMGNEDTLKGYTSVSVNSAKEWAKSKGAHQRFIDVADLYWKYAIQTGLKAEVMYAQAAFETGFGHYKGNVIPEQNNWAGIKRAGHNGDATYDHESFATVEDGVRGHFNHMLAYTGGEPVGIPHARYNVVKSMPWAGSVVLIQDLSGKWCPRADYSDTIVKFVSEMYNF